MQDAVVGAAYSAKDKMAEVAHSISDTVTGKSHDTAEATKVGRASCGLDSGYSLPACSVRRASFPANVAAVGRSGGGGHGVWLQHRVGLGVPLRF